LQRRQFLGSSLAASALALNTSAAQTPAAGGNSRQYYELRKYHLQSGPQEKLTDAYLEHALIPALNRMGMSPIGAFSLYLGPEQPTLYLLIPASSLETLVTAELQLARGQQFLEAARPFWTAPAKEPAFERIESQLMIAFEGYPQLTLPPATATKGNRVFQLRIYESPSHADHIRKVEMFHAGEFDIFKKAGFWNVFFSDTIVGPRLPNLTYMVSFPDLAQMNDLWKAFGADPDWKKLVSSPKFNYESIVSNIASLILNPKSYSQI
jgi:hypothetical protein